MYRNTFDRILVKAVINYCNILHLFKLLKTRQSSTFTHWKQTKKLTLWIYSFCLYCKKKIFNSSSAIIWLKYFRCSVQSIFNHLNNTKSKGVEGHRSSSHASLVLTLKWVFLPPHPSFTTIITFKEKSYVRESLFKV